MARYDGGKEGLWDGVASEREGKAGLRLTCPLALDGSAMLIMCIGWCGV
jgi:hypothetical protein